MAVELYDIDKSGDEDVDDIEESLECVEEEYIVAFVDQYVLLDFRKDGLATAGNTTVVP